MSKLNQRIWAIDYRTRVAHVFRNKGAFCNAETSMCGDPLPETRLVEDAVVDEFAVCVACQARIAKGLAA